MPRAGHFRDRVTVEVKASGALDAYGNPSDAIWSVRGVFWADLRETPGKERLAAGRLEAPVTATLRLRATPETLAILPADRVLARGFTWKIIGAPIDPDGRSRQIEVTLERGGAVQ